MKDHIVIKGISETHWMGDDSASGSYSVLHDPKTPWVALIVLSVLFYTLWHIPLFLLQEAYHSTNEYLEESVRDGTPRRLVGFTIVGLLGIVGLLRQGQHSFRINRALGGFALFYVAWASLSVVWADDVLLTFRRVVILWMLSLGAAAVGKHASPRDIILWLFMTTAAYMLIGLGCEIYYGKFLPFTADYRFSGSLHPNHQGINCAIVVLTGFAAGRSVKRGGAFFIVFALMAIVFLVLTGSRTAFASGMAGLLVYLSVVWSRSSKIALFFVVSTGFCLLMLLMGDKLFSAIWEGLLLGRESSSTSSLTGRIPLWIDCLDHAKGRLLIGYGFTSFFNPARIAKVSATVEWAVGELHSAYLDLLLGVGILGPIAFVAIMVLGIKNSVERFKQLSSPAYAGFAAILVFASLNGVLEITVVSNGLLSFVVMILIAHVGFSVPQDRPNRSLSRPGEICPQEESLAGKTPCVRA